jgi:hypothetical protein
MHNIRLFTCAEVNMKNYLLGVNELLTEPKARLIILFINRAAGEVDKLFTTSR